MTYPRTIAAWSGYAAIDGVTGARHHAAEQARIQRDRDAESARWQAFCFSWRYIGGAAANGYGPAVSS